MIPPALRYLLARQMLGGLQHRLKRLKNPRYAVPLALGLSYFWFAFGMPGLIPGVERPAPEVLPALRVFVGPGLGLLFAMHWMTAPLRPAPIFTVPEASQLFVLPFSRRALIRYRLLRPQVLFLLMACIAGLLSLRSTDVKPYFAAGGVFLLLNMIQFNQMAAAVTMNRISGRGRRRAWMYLPGLVLVLYVVLPVALQWRGPDLAEETMLEWGAALLREGVAGTALAPFHLLGNVVGSAGIGSFALGVGAAIALCLICFGLCMALVSPFEEHSLAQAESAGRQIDAVRRGGFGGMRLARLKRARSSRLPLATQGPAWRAMFWKTLVGEWRAGSWRVLTTVSLLLLLGAIAAVLLNAPRSAFIGGLTLAAGVAFPLALMAPRLLATGMHIEIRRLEMLKALPLSGYGLLRGKTWAGASLTALPATALALAGIIALGPALDEIAEAPAWLFAAAMLSVPVLATGAAVMIALESGLVLMLPAWTVGGQGEAGIELIGRNMVSLMVRVFVGLLMLVVPVALATAATVAFMALGADGWSLIPGGLIGTAALAGEVEVVLAFVGMRFDRMEVSDEIA